MQEKKKVLFFTPGGAGGSQRMTVTIAKMLPLDEFDVKFVVVDNPGSKIENFIPNGYSILYLKIRSIWDFTMFRMAHIMRTEKADAVFCSLRFMAIHMVLGAKICGRKVDCIVRSDNDMKRAKKHNTLLMKLTFPWCKWVIAQQDEMRNELIDVLHLNPQRVISLQNPLDRTTIERKLKDAISPYPEGDNINFVWVGRFNLTKGQDILAEAFVKVHKAIPKSHLYLVGDYNAESEVYRRVQSIMISNKLENYIHIPGYDSNPYRWMKYCNVFVLPSRFEGLPNSLIEAMYIGVPVVAAECIPVIARIVNEGVNGYVVPKENSDAMAEAMIRAIDLKNFSFSYKSAEPEEFVGLFR